MDWLVVSALIGALLLVPTAYAGLIGAPWAPTRIASIKRAFDDIGVSAKDVVVDLGAGDGAIVKQAASLGAQAIGYELSPMMWIIAYIRTVTLKNAHIQYKNFFHATLPHNTTVIFLFLMPKHMERVARYIASQHLPHTTLILSYAFSFPGITPTRVYREKKCAPMYLYELSAVEQSGNLT